MPPSGTSRMMADTGRAEQLLAEYIARKRLEAMPRGARDPDQIPVADVIARYLRDVAATRARPQEAAQRARALLTFFGDKTLAEVNGDVCRRYAAQRSTDAAARRELEDLRAAINYHRREGLCSQIVEVVLPRERPARDRWLTRSEAARLILAAWRYREVQKGKATDRRSRQHIAKFILVALYTGTRASAVCGAALGGRGWIDLDRGVFYRRPAGRLETKKRTPPVPLPRGSWRTCGAGNDMGNGSPSNGTGRRSPISERPRFSVEDIDFVEQLAKLIAVAGYGKYDARCPGGRDRRQSALPSCQEQPDCGWLSGSA
jgi:hypothetical protein